MITSLSCRRPVLAAAVALLLTAVPTVATAQVISPADDPGLQRLLQEVERIAQTSDGTVGVAAVHLETGRRMILNPDQRFPMASSYKVPIAVQLLTRVDRGEISLTDMIELQPQDLHPGSGTLTRLFDDPGVILSVHNLLELMLLISDNSATDLTLATAGGPDAVNARLAELGITGMSVDRPTSLLIADYVGVAAPADGRISIDEFREASRELDEAQREAAAKAFAVDLRDTSTPGAMAALLEGIWRGEALSEENTELLLDILERVQTGTGRIKGMLPRRVTVGHKTGTIGGSTNDVGYIYLPNDAGHVVTVVFVKDSEQDGERREEVIAQVSRAIYDYFLFNPGR